MLVDALPQERVMAQWAESLWWIVKKQGLRLNRPTQLMEFNSAKARDTDGGVSAVLFLLDWRKKNNNIFAPDNHNVGAIITKAAMYAAVCDQFHLVSLFLLEPSLDPWYDDGVLMYLMFDTLKKPLFFQSYESVAHFERRRKENNYAWMAYVHWRTHVRNKDRTICCADSRLMYEWRIIWDGVEKYLARKLCADTMGHVMSFVGRRTFTS
jgi:hypothetical protein